MQPCDPPGVRATHEALRGFPVVITVPVEWGDQDAFGHVNNTVFFRWCETARVVYLDRIGMWEMIAGEKKGPILAAIGCNFRRQVRFPDTVLVGATVAQVGRSSFRMEHMVVSSANAVVADAHSTLVFFDYNEHRPLPVPDHLRRAIERLEGRP
jgi:acyl-CoA thioester hydrolase